MADWVIVVDDSVDNLQTAGHILSNHGIKVSALDSGWAFLDYIKTNGMPDLVLLDILMPEMDGFETLKKLREYEKDMGLPEVPVIFLTATDDVSMESKSFEHGVTDYIRKPFDPDVFVRRIENTLHKEGRMRELMEEAATDDLTGLMNKGAVNEAIDERMKTEKGCLMVVDLDAFKLVNDLYGHVNGDNVLRSFGVILREEAGKDAVCGRIGGDEFLCLTGFQTEEEIRQFTENCNERLLKEAREFMGYDMDIELGVSVGAYLMENTGIDISDAFLLADKALYHLKHDNKHGFQIWHRDMAAGDTGDELSLAHLSAIMEERNILNQALDLSKDTFIPIYRFVMRYIKRYGKSAANVLFTLDPLKEEAREKRDDLMQEFSSAAQNMLRKSDIITRLRNNQLLVMLTEIKKGYVESVVDKILTAWNARYEGMFRVTCESEFYDFTDPKPIEHQDTWVVAVDDDQGNLERIGHILSNDSIRVTALESGQALIDYLKTSPEIPDLILLDVKMPKMDGFETLKRLRGQREIISSIPVIFLTADGDYSSETKGLALGAMDFIKKPIVPQVLLLRVRHTINLVRLQRNLTNEVVRKTEENEQMFYHVVESLTEAIDAKDTYTNGHSVRVAKYTRDIARRYGYDEAQQNDIHMIALLHDVGKIGVPSAVINKPGRLTDEEFDMIKQHPVMGAKILENIKEMPKLVIGARWHHERYGGGGYPDGLSGDDIPEEARIIAVADAYDAMTSRRSYRDALPQEVVRSEIEKGRGTQFDPVFADIMLAMIDEDKDYTMREH